MRATATERHRRGPVGLNPTTIRWPAFLHAWTRVHPDRPVTANELCQSAHDRDPEWAGTFPRTCRGDLPSTRSLGRVLTRHIHTQTGHQVDGVTLHSLRDPHARTRVYWVDTTPTSTGAATRTSPTSPARLVGQGRTPADQTRKVT